MPRLLSAAARAPTSGVLVMPPPSFGIALFSGGLDWALTAEAGFDFIIDEIRLFKPPLDTGAGGGARLLYAGGGGAALVAVISFR